MRAKRRIRAALVAASLWFGLSGAGMPSWGQTFGPAKGARIRMEKRRPIAIQQSYDAARGVNVPFAMPQELQPNAEWGWYELVLTKNRFHYDYTAQVDPTDQLPDEFELLTYNRQRVGPTIRVRRGTKFQIRVHNALHGQVDLGPKTNENPPFENPHGLCTTNLHTHGLHVSPSGRSDNIFKEIDPGCGCTFEYDLPADHPAGTFWYHPHKHGSVAYQLSNGLSGALIVEADPGDRHVLDNIPEIRAASERILVIQWYTYGTFQDPVTNHKVGIIDASTLYNVYNSQDNPLGVCEEVAPKTTITHHAGWNAMAVNGQFNPTMTIAPGEIQRWRMIHAGWDVRQQFLWYKDDGKGTLVPTTDVEVREIATDGLPTGEMTDVVKNGWKIAPGQRSDVLVKAPRPADGKPVTYYLKPKAAEVDPGSPPPPPDLFCAKLVVAGHPVDMHWPPEQSIKDCKLPSIDSGEIGPPSIPDPRNPGKFTDTLSFVGEDNETTYTVNGSTFHDQSPIQLTISTPGNPNTAQEWKLTAPDQLDNVGHPFHIHVNPFQVMSREYTDKKTGMVVKEAHTEWRDTLFVGRGETWTIRSRYRDITGLAVLHCHILDHEDQGMMVPIHLVDPRQPPAPAKAAGPAALRDTRTPAPPLTLQDARGVRHDLAELRGSKLALVFFLGAECSHCTEKLRDLVRDARSVLGADTRIVAVSSRRIADADRALARLGVSASDADRFLLLVDQGRRAFRDFGCDEGGPRHGLFLIDGRGVIRASYTGELPFGDTREAVRRLRALD